MNTLGIFVIFLISESFSLDQRKFGDDLPNATEYGQICLDDLDCLDFLGNNSLCKNNYCRCADNYRWYNGICSKFTKKNDACSDDDLCLDGNDFLALSCQNGICQCNDDYYDRGIDCRIRSELNKDCAIDMDCFNVTQYFVVVSSQCDLGKCVRKNNQINKPRSSIDSQKFYSILESNCTAVQSNLTEEECAECHNTKYLNSMCICQPGFFLYKNHCIAELGIKDPYRSITNDDDCLIKPGRAKDGICYCKNYWFQSSTNRECKKTTLQFPISNCLDNDWCKAMGPYAYCASKTQTCQCISGIVNETNFLCDKPENLTGICLHSDDCPIYENCLDTKCQCIEGFYKYEENDICLPKIGSSCQIRNCSIENSICSEDKICQCADGYVTNGLLCLKPAQHLNESCSFTEQCQYIPYSDCLPKPNHDYQCQCVNEYEEVNDECYQIKDYGSPCTTQFNCTVILGDTFVCRNSICQCPISWKLENNICVNSVLRIYHNFLLSFVLLLILNFIC